MIDDDIFGGFGEDFRKKIEKMFNMDGFFNFENMGDIFNRENTDTAPDNENFKKYSISYKFGTGMDKPEWKVSGNLDEEEMNKIMENLQQGNVNFGFNVAMPQSRPSNVELDFKELSDNLENEGTFVENKNIKVEKAMNKEIVEPFTDIIENPNETMIIMEMCGVEQNNLEISVDEEDKRTLFVRAVAPSVIYEKYIPIEHDFELKNVKGKTKNGIISITIKK